LKFFKSVLVNVDGVMGYSCNHKLPVTWQGHKLPCCCKRCANGFLAATGVTTTTARFFGSAAVIHHETDFFKCGKESLEESTQTGQAVES
jgi:hypothetical protein